MKGTEKIIAQINADAAKQADAILEEAKERCAQIRLEHEKRARELYTEKIRAGVSAGQQKLEEQKEESRGNSLRALEAERQALIDECFKAAREKLPELEQAEFDARLEKIRPGLTERIAKILFD